MRKTTERSGTTRERIARLPLAGLTPAFIYDENQLEHDLLLAADLARATSCRLLYSLKACSEYGVLELIAGHVDGFSCSSLSEAKLAASLPGSDGRVLHLTSPGLRAAEIAEIAALCDFVSLNSITAWQGHRKALTSLPETFLRSGAAAGRRSSPPRCGLRVNPGRRGRPGGPPGPGSPDDPEPARGPAQALDERYDPCRRHSKLGAPLDQVAEMLRSHPEELAGLTGLHLHTTCEETDLSRLRETVHFVAAHLDPLLARLEWINLGGGYLLNAAADLAPFCETVAFLRSRYGMEVFVEPGTALVRKAGYLAASVVDLFPSDGKMVAVVDTTVNHMPEVLEFGFSPDVVGDSEAAPHRYLLAGCSCLAGDVFGEYRFDEPLTVGSRVTFEEAGAYALAKAHWLNGITLPAVWLLDRGGSLKLVRSFSYDDFARQCGATRC
jgi:carboxynorspermidine decarboxylase